MIGINKLGKRSRRSKEKFKATKTRLRGKLLLTLITMTLIRPTKLITP